MHPTIQQVWNLHVVHIAFNILFAIKRGIECNPRNKIVCWCCPKSASTSNAKTRCFKVGTLLSYTMYLNISHLTFSPVRNTGYLSHRRQSVQRVPGPSAKDLVSVATPAVLHHSGAVESVWERHWLVVQEPSWKMMEFVSWDNYSHIYILYIYIYYYGILWKIKHVWNHQPGHIFEVNWIPFEIDLHPWRLASSGARNIVTQVRGVLRPPASFSNFSSSDMFI